MKLTYILLNILSFCEEINVSYQFTNLVNIKFNHLSFYLSKINQDNIPKILNILNERKYILIENLKNINTNELTNILINYLNKFPMENIIQIYENNKNNNLLLYQIILDVIYKEIIKLKIAINNTKYVNKKIYINFLDELLLIIKNPNINELIYKLSLEEICLILNKIGNILELISLKDDIQYNSINIIENLNILLKKINHYLKHNTINIQNIYILLIISENLLQNIAFYTNQINTLILKLTNINDIVKI